MSYSIHSANRLTLFTNTSQGSLLNCEEMLWEFCVRVKEIALLVSINKMQSTAAMNCSGKFWRKLTCSKIHWHICHSLKTTVIYRGPGSSVGIATELRAGRSGIESRWGRDLSPVQTGIGAHPASCKIGTGSFSGVKCGRGMLLTTHPLLVPRSWKSRAIPLPTPWATLGL
jgi:hypothetical protein